MALNADQFDAILGRITDQLAGLIDAARPDADFLQRVVGAVRPESIKVEKFSSGDPVEWISWRNNFKIAAGANGWNNQKQRRVIATAMTGKVKTHVESIPIEDNDQAADAARLLDAYERRFAPPAAT